MLLPALNSLELKITLTICGLNHKFQYGADEHMRLYFYFSPSHQSGQPLALPLSTWYNEISVALSILRKLTNDPAAAADWLLSVNSALSSSQRQLCSLTLIVTYLIITGQEDVCQLALDASLAIAAADPCQVGNPQD